jgi:hypothetical protein
MDLRRDQREYLNVLYAPEESRWELVTFDDPDFDPGFKTELPVDQRQVFQISVFSDKRRDGDQVTVVRARAKRTGSTVEAPVINATGPRARMAADALGTTTSRRAAVLIAMDIRGRA